MPTPSPTPVINPIFSEAILIVVRREFELIAPIGTGAGETPAELPTTRSYGFVA